MSGHYRTLIAESVGMDAILFSAADSKRELYHFRAVTKGSELGAWELFPYIYIYIYSPASLVFVFVSFFGFAFVVYFIGLASYLLLFSKTHEL